MLRTVQIFCLFACLLCLSVATAVAKTNTARATQPTSTVPAPPGSQPSPSQARPPAWAYISQGEMGSFTEPEATLHRWARTAGPLPWVALCLAPLLVAAIRRLRGGRRGRRDRRAIIAAAALLAVSALLAVLAGTLADRVAVRLLPPPRVVRGLVQAHPQPPPPGARGIYAWGESTMHGDVFGPLLSIPKVVAWCLDGRLGGAPVVVENLARPGTSLTRGPPHVLFTVLDDLPRYRPAALLVYVGHNEYYNLRQRRGQPTDSEAERRTVERMYGAALRSLATRAKAAHVPLIIALPVSNIEGHPPPGPRHSAARSKAEIATYERLLDNAEAALARSDGRAALRAARAASQISPEHAWSSFLIGQAARMLGDTQVARAAYRRALILDLNRQRALPSQNAIIQRLCDEGLARCVDAEAAMRAEFAWLDDRAFIDLHHPVARGHALIGQAFARAIVAAVADQPGDHTGAVENRPATRSLPRHGWPPSLDPARAMRERYLQTAGWYLVLAEELTGGYPRARRDALARARRNLAPLRAALPAMPTRVAEALAGRVRLIDLMIATLAGDKATATRLHAEIWARYDWRDGRHPLPEAWMHREIAALLGDDALRPPHR